MEKFRDFLNEELIDLELKNEYSALKNELYTKKENFSDKDPWATVRQVIGTFPEDFMTDREQPPLGPDKETIEAMREAESILKDFSVKRYDDVEEALQELKAEDEDSTDHENNDCLLATAVERMQNFNPEALISEEEANRRLGITETDLKGFEKVELE